jgi:hypothetical protein
MTYLPPIYSQDADYLLKAQKTALTTNSLGLEKIGMLKINIVILKLLLSL